MKYEIDSKCGLIFKKNQDIVRAFFIHTPSILELFDRFEAILALLYERVISGVVFNQLEWSPSHMIINLQ